MRQLKINVRVTNRDTFSLEKYLIDVNKLKMISVDEEAILASKIQSGDEDALNKLVSANLRFVISVVKQYQNQGLPLQDLINEGNLGLIKAAQKFDPSKGFKFISYAVWWIRQSVLQALATHGRTIRLPSNKIGLINRIKTTKIKLEQKFEREPTYEELADETKLEINNIEELCAVKVNTLSMDCPIDIDSETTLLDLIIKSDFNNPDAKLLNESESCVLSTLLKRINEKERVIIQKYYGLNGISPITLGEIGNELDISAEQVRRLKKSAIRKLKKFTEELIYITF